MQPRPARRSTALTLTLLVSLAFAGCSDDSGGLTRTTSADSVITESADAAASTVPADTEPLPTEPPTTQPAATEPTASDPSTTAPPTTEPAVTEPATAASGPLDPLDDLDEDGTFDERCGTADLGGGLVVETLCDTSLAPAPEGGVTPTPQSLLLVPTPLRWEDLADVDATVRVATTPDGRRVAIYVLGSDTLFDSGNAAVRSTAQPPLAAIVASINARFPGAPVQVRGAADSVGAADANQTLSEQRAAAVAEQLTGLGIDPALVMSIGLGANVPVALETNADGTVSEIGRQVNRRVEIVVG